MEKTIMTEDARYEQRKILLAERADIERKPHLTDRDLAVIRSINRQLGIPQ